MNLTKKPEPREPKSVLNIIEWIQFMKDECNSLEEEKRFIFTKLIALFTFVAILFGMLYNLLTDQISFNISEIDGNAFEIKMAAISLVFVVSFQIYKIISLFYSILFHSRIYNVINLPKEFMTSERVNIIPIVYIFIVLLIHRLIPNVLSVSIVPIETLKSLTYLVLILITGLESFLIIIIIIFEKKFSESMEKELINNKEKLNFSFKIGVLYQIFILALIILVIINVNWPSIELFMIQLKFGLVFMLILFISIYWGKPLSLRLNVIATRIEQLQRLIDEALHDEITKPEDIILRRDNFKMY